MLFLPVVLLDVELVVVADIFEIHYLDVRFCCQNCCCRTFSIIVVECFVEIIFIECVHVVFIFDGC